MSATGNDDSFIGNKLSQITLLEQNTMTDAILINTVQSLALSVSAEAKRQMIWSKQKLNKPNRNWWGMPLDEDGEERSTSKD